MTDLTSPTPPTEPIDENAAHRIVITFPDDHTLQGMRLHAEGVTPEQIATASFHLIRQANRVADIREIQASGQAAEMQRVMTELRKGH